MILADSRNSINVDKIVDQRYPMSCPQPSVRRQVEIPFYCFTRRIVRVNLKLEAKKFLKSLPDLYTVVSSHLEKHPLLSVTWRKMLCIEDLYQRLVITAEFMHTAPCTADIHRL